MTARLYRLALHLLPAEVRDRHGDPMAAVFDELVREARQRRGTRGVARVVAAELLALARFAISARRGLPPPRRLDERVLAGEWPAYEGASMLTAIVQDLRYAMRLLRRSPGFAAVCITTVALAIGANTAIFSVMHGVMLKALPFAAPERLVVLGHHTNGGEAIDSTTPGNLYDWMRAATAFESIAGFSSTERIFTVGDGAERLRGGLCIGPLFEVLGRQAAQGRALTAGDDDPRGAAGRGAQRAAGAAAVRR